VLLSNLERNPCWRTRREKRKEGRGEKYGEERKKKKDKKEGAHTLRDGNRKSRDQKEEKSGAGGETEGGQRVV